MNNIQLLKSPVIRSGAITGIDALTTDFARSREHVLRETDCDTFDHAKSTDFIPLQRYADSLERGARLSRHQNFSLVFGNRFDTRNLGPLGYAVRYAPTLGDALTLFCENFDAVQDQTDLKLETAGDEARLIYSVKGINLDVKDHDAEASIGILHGICRRSVGTSWSASKMTFMHQRKQAGALAQALFGLVPEYGADTNKLCFDRRFLDAPVKSCDPYLLGLLKHDVEETSRTTRYSAGIIQSVRLVVGAQIRKSRDFCFASVAAEMGVGERTLRDRLKAANESYRNIVASERVERAKWLLEEGNLTITEIAFDVGFSETSALSRAFRLFTGVSPQAYRGKQPHSV